MKALVFSDIHGFYNVGIEMLEKEKDCDTVFFLGDGVRDAEKLRNIYSDKKFIIVKGNNDYSSPAETEAYRHIDGVTVMACHGHLFDVRYTLNTLLKKAEGVRANIVLYGHTHRANMYNDALTGVCAINPGALCEFKYCVLTIEKGKFDVQFKSLI